MSAVNLLILEDNPDDAELVIFELEAAGFDLSSIQVDSREDYLENLSSDIDIIISDFNLPNFTGLKAYQLLKEQDLDIPFILVSGTIGEEKAVECIKQGINDYILKDRLMRLPSAVKQALNQSRLHKDNQEMLLALQRSEERLNAIVNALPDVVYLIDEKLNFVDVITGRPELLNIESEHLINQPITDMFPDRPAKMISDAVQDTITLDNHQVIEYDLDVQVGNRIFESRIAPTNLVIDNKQTAVMIARDITHHKKLQEDLTSLINATSYLFKGESIQQVGEQVVKAVVEALGQVDCGLLLVDSSERILLRVARNGDYVVDTDEILYMDGLGVVPSAIRAGQTLYVPDTSQDDRYLANNPHTQSELVVPLIIDSKVIGALDLQSPQKDAFSDESRRIVEIFAERASSAINIQQLIDEINQKSAQLEWRVAQRTADLQKTTEQIEVILNSSQDVIVLCDAQGLIKQVNPAFNTVFHYDANEVFNQSLDIIVHDSDKQKLDFARESILKDKTMQRLDISAVTSDDKAFFADVVLSPILDPKNRVNGIICSIRDISKRKQLETDLRDNLQKEKELNELKSRFVSMVSHEYRTPLATILLSSELLKNYNERLSAEKRVQHLDKISTQIQHMKRLMEDILVISKTNVVGQKVERKTINVKLLIDDIIHDLTMSNKDHSIRSSVPDICKTVNADPRLITTIVTNLLTNAIKYSPDDGQIDVFLDCDEQSFTISVKDNGIGIPESDQKHLFEMFHRATNVGTIQGTGLGLVIVKQCVEAHGGTLDFKSEENVGTTFIARFPLVLGVE